ncbi:RNA-directed DNA polymerase, eukaryota, reverse transcriptase zinc-binding domain protein, partial [Tanacetum coccineum]
EFKMERGLRQGDSLSPFLFLLVAEALQVSITEACNKGFYKGVYRSEDGSNVSLLQYADDALLFGKWSRSNARNLILILKCFEEASAPLKIIKLLESLRCRFFWGFNEDHHGISWVKWDSILVSPKHGGLWVGSLLAKNLALLGKWKWRYITEKDALWRKVICCFYGVDGGFSSLVGSNIGQGIWCDIKSISNIESIDSSFKNSFSLKVSNGLSISFWKDVWCPDGSRLMDLFPRLFVTSMI